MTRFSEVCLIGSGVWLGHVGHDLRVQTLGALGRFVWPAMRTSVFVTIHLV